MSTEPSAPAERARRGRPPAQNSEDTYKRILTAARRCFSRQGYERTAIADIASEAGVTPRALYHYVLGFAYVPLERTGGTVKFALNVWAGWGPIILANNGFAAGHVWKTPDGKEFKGMTIKYTRAADGSASR